MFSFNVFLLPFTGGRVDVNPSLVQAILPNVQIMPWKYALFQKLGSTYLIKKFPTFYEILKFISVQKRLLLARA